MRTYRGHERPRVGWALTTGRRAAAVAVLCFLAVWTMVAFTEPDALWFTVQQGVKLLGMAAGAVALGCLALAGLGIGARR